MGGCILNLHKVKHIIHTSIVNKFCRKCYNICTSCDGKFCYTPFEVPPLGHYEPSPAIVPLLAAILQAIICDLIQHCHCSYLTIRPSKLPSIKDLFQSQIKAKIGGARLGEYSGYESSYIIFCLIFVKKSDRCVHTVVVQKPISSSPQLQVFPVESVSQAAKNVSVQCLVHSVAQWNVLFEEDFQHHLAIWYMSTKSLFLWRSWALSVRSIPLSLWVIKITSQFITCDYSVQNVQARDHLLMRLPLIADGSFAQLVFGEIFLNHVATNVTHVQITMEQFESLKQVPTFLATAFPWHRRWCHHFVQ